MTVGRRTLAAAAIGVIGGVSARGMSRIRLGRLVDEDESLRRYGLRPSIVELDQIRRMLREQVDLGPYGQDTLLMKLCCVQLFNAGLVTDVLDIWRARESGWDAHHSSDVQLLCGAGLDTTKEYLSAEGSEATSKALRYLVDCERAGDFHEFSVEKQARWWADYYLG